MNNNNNRIKKAFNVRENFRDIYCSENSRMLFMDGLRCLGMFHIMFTHSLWAFLIGFKAQFQPFIQDIPWYLRWLLAGDKAVDLFFVISGFLIGQMLFKEYYRTQKIDLKRFFWRRFWRLTPAYYLVIVLFAVFVAGPQVDKNYLWAFVFYVNNYIPIEHNYISYAWSLAIEEQFYGVFSLFVAFVFFKIRRQLTFLWCMYGFSFLILWYLLWINPEILLSVDILISKVTVKADDYWEIIYDNLHTRYGSIVLGIILAHLYVYHWQTVTQYLTIARCRWVFVAALSLFVLTLVLPVYSGESSSKTLLYFYHITHRNLFGLGVMLIMLLCLLNIGVGEKVNNFLSSKVFYPVSQLTYSMYLLHLPVIAACYLTLKGFGIIDSMSYANATLVFLSAIIPTIFFSALMYIFIEKPFMKLRS
jgi:peptidoglycan/LPS O-acetylase OafA/YrhL